MNPGSTQAMARELKAACRALPPIQIMEVCGTHTVSLYRSGVKSMLPETLRMVSGPGCPVCVSSQGYIDAACEIAARPGVTVCTYGDMLRVPGRRGSLQDRRAEGADVRVVYSALDAVGMAAAHPRRDVVFLAVGFETTAPGHAAAVLEAARLGLANFFLLCAHKRVVPAMLALLEAGDVPLDGFLCPGHVSVIIGAHAYRPVIQRFQKPCVVAGFEPEQMLRALLHLVRQIAAGEARIENVYTAAVGDAGNASAERRLEQVFEPAETVWRAIGTIPDSGLELRGGFRRFDALRRFKLSIGPDYDLPGCRCGEVIQGKSDPRDCPLFARGCSPLHPVGPCMVSGEGTCAAAFKYDRDGATRVRPTPEINHGRNRAKLRI